ncbi:hypothetical protein SPB21_12585 [Leptothoe sp. ISB3NOV94-8A]
MVNSLSKQQELMLNDYSRKWSNSLLKKDNLDDLNQTINDLYTSINLTRPEIYHFSSIESALRFLLDKPLELMGSGIELLFEQYLIKELELEISGQIEEKLWWKKLYKELSCDFREAWSSPMDESIWENLSQIFLDADWEKLSAKLWDQNPTKSDNSSELVIEYSFNVFSSWIWNSACCLYDFCISELRCKYNQKKWKILKDIIGSCDYLFPYQNICLIAVISEHEKSWLSAINLDDQV